ncbi:MAG: alpha-xylosidase, partial [Actinomycetales bacterium]|nr:alpha-xylosidase [Actinomycetales bacterium]
MKFSDGYWLLRPGVTALRPRDIDAVERDGRELLVYAPTSPIQERGDTLNRPLLTVRVTSPLPDVIGVRISHHVGAVDRGPHFPLARTDHPVEIDVPERPGKGDATFTAGRLTARIATGGAWGVAFEADGRVLTSSMERSVAALDTPEGSFVREQLTLGVTETLYGLGERFGTFARNGQSI